MLYSDRLVAFIEAWEGFKPVASGDPLVAGVRDIGYGHVLQRGEDYGRIGKDEAEAILRADLDYVSAGVTDLVKVPLVQHQHDALVSFAFNVGLDIDADSKPEGLGDSTLLKHVNAAEFGKAALQFTLWIYAGGKKIDGLWKRRVAEQAMFMLNDYSGRP